MKPYTFVHIPKTGGKSLGASLGLQHHHATARSLLGGDHTLMGWSFTVVRNPWDHAASWFLHRRKYLVTPTVSDWARRGFTSPGFQGRSALDQMDWISDGNGKILVDTTYRFEQGIPEIYREACQRIGIKDPAPVRHDNQRTTIPEDAVSLRHLPGFPARPHYSAFYSDEAVEMVAERQAEFLQRFPYTFEDRR